MKEELINYKDLEVVIGKVEDIIVFDVGLIEEERVEGVRSKIIGVRLELGEVLLVRLVVIIIGIFLGGEIYIGFEVYLLGRMGEEVIFGFSKFLCEVGFKFGCFKIGMLLCLVKGSINWDIFEEQFGDDFFMFFSYFNDKVDVDGYQFKCYVIYINYFIYDIVCVNFDRIIYICEMVKGLWYCFFFEFKIICFGYKDFYIVWFEFEGFDNEVIYFNGFFMIIFVDV